MFDKQILPNDQIYGTEDDEGALVSIAGQHAFTVTIATLLVGDFDGNNKVDFLDFLAFAQGFGTKQGEEKFDAKFDFDNNRQ